MMDDRKFRFSITIPVRFGDMDALGHVNNATYLTYFEEARLAYWRNLFPVDLDNVGSLNMILAEATVSFRNPARVADVLEVFVRVSEFGTKSFRMEYRIEKASARELVAEGFTVMVRYDYAKSITVPVPDSVKEKILAFDNPSS